MIRQGDIYRVELGEPIGSEPGFKHPHVVVQNDVFNGSRIHTVVVYALTSNLQRAEASGYVLLKPGEANLPKQSVVNVSQIFAVDRRHLEEETGSLSMLRIQEILEGIRLVLEARSP